MKAHEKIKQLRISKGLNQSEVAQKLGITPPAYGKYERGGDISLSRLTQIAELFEVPIFELLGSEQKEEVQGMKRDLEAARLIIDSKNRTIQELKDKLIEVLLQNQASYASI